MSVVKFPYSYPEHLLPAITPPLARQPINSRDARHDIDKLLADQRTVWDWATSAGIAVLSINGDRNGAYLCVAPTSNIHTLFGDECASVQRKTENGLITETWLGLVGHIRVFWREVTCTH